MSRRRLVAEEVYVAGVRLGMPELALLAEVCRHYLLTGRADWNDQYTLAEVGALLRLFERTLARRLDQLDARAADAERQDG